MPELKELIPMWDHQRIAVNAAKDRENYAFFADMGVGKSAMCINTLRYKYMENGRVLKTLIICPLIVTTNWVREFSMHSKIDPKDILVLGGSQIKRLGAFKKAIQENPNKIFILNYEALVVMKDLYQAIYQWRPEILVCDESHKLKTHNSKRTKAVIDLADRAKHKYLLTGTPILGSPLDIFSQFRIMDGGAAFAPNGTNFFGFRARYFFDANAGMPRDRYFPNWKIRPGAMAEMNEIIAKNAMRVKKEDCLTLPPLVREIIYVPLSAEQEKAYQEMKNDFVTYVQDDACVATLALTKVLRLQQIISGYIQLETGHQAKVKNNPRQEALYELLETLTPSHKVLVWAVFKENFEQIREVCERLKLKYVEVHGDIPNTEKFNNVDRFNSDPDIRVFIGHAGSGGIGISLIASDYSIFYSRGFSLEHDLQAEARNYRGGQTKTVVRIDLVAPNTVDEIILKRLSEKMEMGTQLLEVLKKEL